MGNAFGQSYPYTCTYKKKQIILIWQTSDQFGDRFKVDEENKLIFSDSEEKLKELLGITAKEVFWEEGTEIDFNRFWNSLTRLRINQASSKKTCELLLNGWNFIEDVLRTFSLTVELEKLQSPTLNIFYKKLFYGNNLPSITPNGCSYTPWWTSDEIFSVQKEFKHIWSFLRKNGYLPF